MVFNLHQKYGALSDDLQSEPESVGKCIIFNHEKYRESMNCTERIGTEIDAVGLKEAFSSMGFRVERHDNCKVSQIFEILDGSMFITLLIYLVHMAMNTIVHP